MNKEFLNMDWESINTLNGEIQREQTSDMAMYSLSSNDNTGGRLQIPSDDSSTKTSSSYLKSMLTDPHICVSRCIGLLMFLWGAGLFVYCAIDTANTNTRSKELAKECISHGITIETKTTTKDASEKKGVANSENDKIIAGGGDGNKHYAVFGEPSISVGNSLPTAVGMSDMHEKILPSYHEASGKRVSSLPSEFQGTSNWEE